MCESVFKVLVVGDSAVGKTAMVARYCHSRWLANYKVTLGGKLSLAQVNRRLAASCRHARCYIPCFAAADYAVKTLTWKDREAIRLHVNYFVLCQCGINFVCINT